MPAGSRLRARVRAASRWTRRALFEEGSGRLPALDGIRAIAALWVVAFHAQIALRVGFGPDAGRAAAALGRVLGNGWMGVDLFFALSGFLIGGLLLERHAGAGRGLAAFYVRRTFRIVPAYYLVLTASALVLARLAPFKTFLYAGEPAAVIAARSWANYLFVSNYVYGVRIGNALDWGWSLCIEEQFYLVVPWLLRLLVASRAGGPALALLCLAPGALRAVAWAGGARSIFDRLYVGTHTHADGLLAGLLVAWALQRGGAARAWLERAGDGTALAGLALVGAAVAWGGLSAGGFFGVVGQIFCLGVGAALLVAAAAAGRGHVARALGARAWRPLARLSYATYLLNPFVVVVLAHVCPVSPGALGRSVPGAIAFVLVAQAATLAVATPLFLLLEEPLRRLGVRWSRRLMPPRSAAG